MLSPQRLLVCSLFSAAAHATPVINEIHYNNDLNTVCNEFVELHNPGTSAVELGGWRLTGAVEFIFPAGTTLPAAGYVVVAEDPSTVASEFGVSALGPYSGGLNSGGERLELVDTNLTVIDVVDYRVGFPWPSLAAGDGSSMELVNPGLDNDLGSSWRSSATGFSGSADIFIAAASQWRYRKGFDEASDPIHAWTANGFIEDASWLEGQAPIGRGEALAIASVDDIQNSYSSIFLRKEFTVSGTPPPALVLKTVYDDGVIVWLNGTEIYRSDSVDPGTIDYRGNDGNNADHDDDGTAIASDEQDGYEEYAIGGTAALLQTGTNVLAVQVFNDTIGSSDILIDATLETPPPFYSQAQPSPGMRNSSATSSPPPNIRQVAHLPISPTSIDPVTISAKITDPDGVAAVTLSYQVVEPGSYIRKADPGYEQGWIDLAMSDPGNDGSYSATVPAAGHRELVRYRITCSDSNGASLRAPFDDDAQSNFAYFVYDGTPPWSGANQPGVDAPTTFPPALLDQLATYHLIANATDVTNSQYSSGSNNTRFSGTLIYDGVVYDHIDFKVGGTGSTYLSGKNKWRIYFNPARELRARDNYGERYGESWDKLTMNACSSPRAAGNRAMAGLDEAISFRTYQLASTLSPNTSFLHFRVIDDVIETSPTDQYSGDLWGLYLAIEEIDGTLLDEHGLPDGNVYRIEGNSREHQAKHQPANGSDWSTFSSGSGSTNTETWWRQNLDLERYYSFRACNRVVGNVDLRTGGNHFFYHGSSSDGTQSRWVPVPWDLDMMFISIGHQSGTIRQQNCLNHSAISIEFKNRCREVLDLLLDDPAADGGQIGQLVDEFAQIVNPTGELLTWADLDRHMWNHHPRTKSSSSPKFDHLGNFLANPTSETRAGGTWTRTFDTADFEGSQKYLLDYMTDVDPDPASWSRNSGDQRGYGYNYLASEAADPNIPDTPVITYTGVSGFPTNGLSFQSSAFSDPQGSGTSAAIEWRIGEIDGTPGVARIYEIEENWTSEEIAPLDPNISPPAASVKPGHSYRARVRHLDSSGRWSHWSAPFQFVASAPDVSALQQNLIISEIMYNPASGQDHEYIELHNTGDTELDLTDVRFTKGIDFDFPIGTTVEAGSYLLVVKDIAAFEALYGSGLPVAGTYGLSSSNSLSNGGERIKLALGSYAIHDFEYNDTAPWPTGPDGTGVALVLNHTSDNAALDPLDPLGHGVAANWRQGTSGGGTPGAAAPSSPFSGDPNADEDEDGLDAFLEHALGSSDSDPGIADISGTFEGNQMTFSFPRNPTAKDVLYIVETSPVLLSWTAGATLQSQTATGATYAFEPTIGSQRQFIRLRVEEIAILQR